MRKTRKTLVSKIQDWGWVIEHQNGTERRYLKLEENEGDKLRLCYCFMPPRRYAFIRVNSRETVLAEAIWDLEFKVVEILFR